MTNYVFKPNKRSGRNKYAGAWSETAHKKIELPFTVESLRLVLSWGMAPDRSVFSHQDIAHWCDRFHMGMFDIDTNHDIDIATGVATDVDAQWDMFIANTYNLEQLRELDFAKVVLPVEWFHDWLNQVDAC